MKKKEREEISGKIYDAITPRLNELMGRCYDNNTNDAYMAAFICGIIKDIDDEIKKLQLTTFKRSNGN